MPGLVHPAVGDYVSALSAPEGQFLADVRSRSIAAGVRPLGLDAAALLHVIAVASAPRRIFEIGTGYGYSAILLARALAPDGLLFTVERDPDRAAVARAHVERAGLADRVNVMVGEAARLVHKVAGPFGLILQDGAEDQYEPVLDRLVALLGPRGVLISNSILCGGDAVPGLRDAHAPPAERAAAITNYNRRLAADARLATVFLPAGDGIAVSVRLDGNRDLEASA